MKRFLPILLTAVLLLGVIAVPGVTASAVNISTGTLVTFGSYPQSRVTDSSLLARLNSMSLSWTYYDYYCDSKQEDFMKYADITYSGERYRAVTFNHYRPYWWTYSDNADVTLQDENGYEPNKVYWFRFDPIVWRVLDTSSGLLMAENLIDSQPFHNVYYYNNYGDQSYTYYASNWAYSSLRAWMNGDFCNTAFGSEKSYIKNTSLTTPSSYSSEYDAAPTNDKVFLLSRADVLNPSYGFSSDNGSGADTNRIAYGTDYARCQGLYVDSSTGFYYSGASYWRLRTPYNNGGADYVDYDGSVYSYSGTNSARLGIRPALNVNLQSAISQSLIKINNRDTEAPTGSISSTNNVAATQTVTLTMSDNAGIAGYYWGTSSTYTNNSFTSTSASNATETVSSPVTYYFVVKDTSGNTSPTSPPYSITFYKTTLDANGGSVSPSSVLTAAGKSFTLPTPTRSGYTFDGWYTSASGGTEVTSSTVTGNVTLYAHWTEIPQTTYYTVSYNANGGTGAPSAQVKTKGVSLTLSTIVPTKAYTIYYNANGGSVSPASKSVSCTFNKWNTASNGSGTSYAPGSTYTADADVTLYAQWTNPSAGTLATPTRSGYTFDGWYTSASGGSKVTSSSTVTGNVTLYAHWTEIPKTTYTVSYNANGGTGTPSAQVKTKGESLTLSTIVPTKAYTIYYNANGGSVSPASKSVSCTFNKWNTASNGSGASYASGGTYTADADATLYAQWTNPSAGTLATPARSDYTFDGWYTSASGGTKVTSSSIVTGNVTLYAHWTEIPQTTYTVSYNVNGGTGTPSAQVKTKGVSLTLSSVVPTKKYTVYYNASGGSVSPASKSVSCTFNKWNTASNGSGASYAPGSTYTADADATLYAQWTNPSAGTLATPTRSGYTFDGWYTSASGGSKVTSSSQITANTTIYAHWSPDIYNLGEETYSFENYGDADSAGGHCFGMSMTSSGYYLGYLDFKTIGGNSNSKLYEFSDTDKVKAPICYYQAIQGSYSKDSIVAGGSSYNTGTADIATDWQEVVNYVKNHGYDNTGALQIGFRKSGEGGHAVNFLRYENIDGQDRIYAYDNNFPDQETYFYRSSGRVYQAPVATFSGPIDCIALRNVATYFSIAGDYDSSRVIYCAKDDVYVRDLTAYAMEDSTDGKEYVMYEIPEGQERVIIIPLSDNADFIYMDTEYSFGAIDDETYGTLDLADMDEGSGGTTNPSFKIYNAPKQSQELVLSASGVTLSWTSKAYNSAVQKPTVTVKNTAGTTLTEGTSYTVSYSAESKVPGTYTVTVTGKGRYSGTVTKEYKITKQPLAASRITLSWTSKAYNSSVQKPTVTVKNAAGTTLTEGTSYTVSYSAESKAPGTYTVTVTGKGSFSGSVTKEYTITKQALTASRITLSWTSKSYNSSVQKPTVTVKNAAGTTLTEGTSYIVSYSAESKAPGTYTVTVTGKGSFSGSVTKEYTITKQALTASRITLSWTSKAYNGEVQKPTVTVKNAAGTKLTEGTSYTLEWSEGSKLPGTYTVTVKAKGDKYSGSVSKTYTISKQALAASRITLSWTSKAYNGEVQKPTVTVKNAAGLKLTEGTSYTLEWSGDSKLPGTYTVTVKGKGDKYSGSVSKTYTISKQALASSRITLSWTSKAYNGEVQKPTVTVKNAAGLKLTEGTSYTLTWSGDSKLPGTYTVTVKAKGDKYSGSVPMTYTIGKQALIASRITLSWTSKAYNGEVQKPAVTVKNAAGLTLTEGTSYTLEWSGDSKLPGTYTVTVKGKGDKYSGSVPMTYTISKQALASSRITLSWTSKAYNGEVQKPTVTVKNAAGLRLTEGTSYTLKWSGESKQTGDYTVTVTAKGDKYSGTVTKTYSIR